MASSGLRERNSLAGSVWRRPCATGERTWSGFMNDTALTTDMASPDDDDDDDARLLFFSNTGAASPPQRSERATGTVRPERVWSASAVRQSLQEFIPSVGRGGLLIILKRAG